MPGPYSMVSAIYCNSFNKEVETVILLGTVLSSSFNFYDLEYDPLALLCKFL